MFHSDPHAMRQVHAADMHVAHQRRTRGKVVAPRERRWHRALLTQLTRWRSKAAERPVVTAFERAERRHAQSTLPANLIDASTGHRLSD